MSTLAEKNCLGNRKRKHDLPSFILLANSRSVSSRSSKPSGGGFRFLLVLMGGIVASLMIGVAKLLEVEVSVREPQLCVGPRRANAAKSTAKKIHVVQVAFPTLF